METNKSDNSEQLSLKEIKTKILNLRNEIPKEEAEIAGVTVWIHGLSSYGLESWRLVKNNNDPAIAKLAAAKLIQLTMRDADGVRVFEDNELTIIAGLPAVELEPLCRTAMKLSGYGIEAQAEILKNLLTTPGDDGSSEPPENTNAV